MKELQYRSGMDEEEDDIYSAVLALRERTHYYEKLHSQKFSKLAKRIININYGSEPTSKKGVPGTRRPGTTLKLNTLL